MVRIVNGPLLFNDLSTRRLVVVQYGLACNFARYCLSSYNLSFLPPLQLFMPISVHPTLGYDIADHYVHIIPVLPVHFVKAYLDSVVAKALFG